MPSASVLEVSSLWNGRPARPDETARIALVSDAHGWRMTVDAPFFADPRPPGSAGSTEGLWEYEVVELLVVARESLATKPVYTEIELSPHGHHLVLRFAGVRERVGVVQPLTVEATITEDRWQGELLLAAGDLPAPPWSANAVMVHGRGDERRFLSATALPGSVPDFHQPAAFPHFPVPKPKR